MQPTLVIGYNTFFGELDETYEDLIKDLPSHLVIKLCVILNNELSAPIDSGEIQKRLISLVSQRFTPEQNAALNKVAYRFYIDSDEKYTGYVFGRRYLIAMLLKELNNYRDFNSDEESPILEYNFLKSYLLIVDEVNKADNDLFDSIKMVEEDPLSLVEDVINTDNDLTNSTNPVGDDPFSLYKILWTPFISQFEFSEKTDIGFETFKLAAFLEYSLRKFRPYLIEYLIGLGFKTIGNLHASFKHLNLMTQRYAPNDIFTKLVYTNIGEGQNDEHLRKQSINQIIGREEPITLFDIKKYPLYLNADKGYTFIDGDIYNKKIYKGAFFDLYRETSLKNELKFVPYSGDISKNVLESKCLQIVLRLLNKSVRDLLYFDDGTESIPDGYLRSGNKIFLFEFKANIISDNLTSNPNFDKIKEFIDTRLGSKKKGVGQLIQQIKDLLDNKFVFDKGLKYLLDRKKLIVYPIICHIEHTFALPGINKYLDDKFQEQLSPDQRNKLEIKPTTVIDLQVLFDFTRSGKELKDFEVLLNRYHKIVDQRRKKLNKKRSKQTTFLRAYMSFDELYHSLYLKEIKNNPAIEISLTAFIRSLGLTTEILNENLL